MTRLSGIALAVVTGLACSSTRIDRGIPDSLARAADIGDPSVALVLQRQMQLLGISYTIRTRSVELCGDQTGPILGIAVLRPNRMHSTSFSAALSRRFGVSARELVVTALLPGSPADRAGLRAGDQIDRVDGHVVRTELDVFDRARAARGSAFRIELTRDGVSIELDVEALAACQHEVFLEIGDLMLTDRSGSDHAYVTSGFVRFTRSDDELALVVAHEIAHRLVGPSALRGPNVETRADQIGMYLAARAGFDVTVAPAFWDRVALEQPWSLSNEVEHYGWSRVPPHAYMPARAVAIRKIAESIRAKLARGESLRPD